jgi:hypothetical protein
LVNLQNGAAEKRWWKAAQKMMPSA